MTIRTIRLLVDLTLRPVMATDDQHQARFEAQYRKGADALDQALSDGWQLISSHAVQTATEQFIHYVLWQRAADEPRVVLTDYADSPNQNTADPLMHVHQTPPTVSITRLKASELKPGDRVMDTYDFGDVQELTIVRNSRAHDPTTGTPVQGVYRLVFDKRHSYDYRQDGPGDTPRWIAIRDPWDPGNAICPDCKRPLAVGDHAGCIPF